MDVHKLLGFEMYKQLRKFMNIHMYVHITTLRMFDTYLYVGHKEHLNGGQACVRTLGALSGNPRPEASSCIHEAYLACI